MGRNQGVFIIRLQEEKLNEMNRKDKERLRIQSEQKEQQQEYMRNIMKRKNDRY